MIWLILNVMVSLDCRVTFSISPSAMTVPLVKCVILHCSLTQKHERSQARVRIHTHTNTHTHQTHRHTVSNPMPPDQDQVQGFTVYDKSYPLEFGRTKEITNIRLPPTCRALRASEASPIMPVLCVLPQFSKDCPLRTTSKHTLCVGGGVWGGCLGGVYGVGSHHF